jgi:hypothetical protein
MRGRFRQSAQTMPEVFEMHVPDPGVPMGPQHVSSAEQQTDPQQVAPNAQSHPPLLDPPLLLELPLLLLPPSGRGPLSDPESAPPASPCAPLLPLLPPLLLIPLLPELPGMPLLPPEAPLLMPLLPLLLVPLEPPAPLPLPVPLLLAPLLLALLPVAPLLAGPLSSPPVMLDASPSFPGALLNAAPPHCGVPKTITMAPTAKAKFKRTDAPPLHATGCGRLRRMSTTIRGADVVSVVGSGAASSMCASP